MPRSLLIAALLLLGLGCLPGRGLAQETGSPGGPATVEIGIYIVNVFDIDFSTSNFNTIFWATFLYQEGTFDPDKGLELIEAQDLRTLAAHETRQADGRIYRSVKYQATINQNWDTRYYPFDRQVLRFTLESVGVETDKLQFKVNAAASYFEPTIVIPGWYFVDFQCTPSVMTYSADFTDKASASSSFPRLVVDITLHRWGVRDFATDFLGFYVAKTLAAATLVIESFEISRTAVPVVARLNLVVGALFGAVGNSYIVDRLLPSHAVFTLPDLIEISAFLDIGIALVTVIGAETLATAGLSTASLVVARTALGLSAAAHLGLLALLNGAIAD